MIRFGKRKLVLAAVAGASVFALSLAGCSAQSGGSDGGGDAGQVLNINAGSQTPIVANFNPFAPTVLYGTPGMIYEPLFFYNKTSAEPPTPQLAESFEFSDDGREMTIILKDGITWNDGEPFTAADAAFTYNFELSKRAYLDKAEAVDDTTVKLSFNEPAFTNEFQILGASLMIPEHIWADVEDPQEWANEAPVGTGPYVVKSVSDAAYVLKANPKFRTPGIPAVKEIRYLGIDSNGSAADLMKAGKIDWQQIFSPDPDSLTAGGTISYINTPQDPTVLYTCSNAELGCVGPQTDLAVRQALNVAIDRGTITEKAFVGLAAEISPTFALLGRDDKWIGADQPKASPQSADIAEVASILEAAGYAKGSDGFYAKDGKTIELSLISVDGWTDYNDAARLIQEQTAAAGIKVTATTVSWNEFSDARQGGNFQLIMGGVTGTSVGDPFQIYKDWFSTVSTTAVGEILVPGTWNFSRYSNPVVDAAVNAASETNDEAAKKVAYDAIQTEIVRDLPYIPIVINATQTFMNTKDFTGWPTDDNLYAFPPSWAANSAGFIMQQVKPVK